MLSSAMLQKAAGMAAVKQNLLPDFLGEEAWKYLRSTDTSWQGHEIQARYKKTSVNKWQFCIKAAVYCIFFEQQCRCCCLQ